MRSESGQSSVEYMLVISVVVVAVVAAGYVFVPLFQNGVQDLGTDVSNILSTGELKPGTGGAQSGSGIETDNNPTSISFDGTIILGDNGRDMPWIPGDMRSTGDQIDFTVMRDTQMAFEQTLLEKRLANVRTG